MTTEILILTGAGDAHASAVATQLERAGRTVRFFDYGLLPSRGQLIYRAGPGGRRRRVLASGNTEIDLDRVGAIWLRRPTPIAHDVPAQSATFVKAETAEFVSGLLGAVDCTWMPAHPMILRIAECKIDQLWRAERIGFEIPPTLITNSRAEALQFYRDHQGDIVSKVAARPALNVSYPQVCRYTEPVTRMDLLHLGRLGHCPTTFQANVPKRFEVRATVVGGEVFAAEIHSQDSQQASLDWRHYDLGNTPHHSHRLPATVAGQCVALVRDLGLTYGAIDLIVRPDGGYVFIEINPNGQYLWLEEMAGLPISAAIADFLGRATERAMAA
jgi:glutathione synthase/RimK-type ligase-like ATP-grasp enzyme